MPASTGEKVALATISVLALGGGLWLAYQLFTQGKQTPQLCFNSGGSCGTSAVFATGADMTAVVTAAPGTTPVSTNTVINSQVFGDRAWAGGASEVIDYGPAPSAGTYTVYEIVNYADGTSQLTNTCTVIVT